MTREVTITLTKEEIASIIDVEHHHHGEPHSHGCCHCELGNECASILQKVGKVARDLKR